MFNANAQQKQVGITIDDLPTVTNGIAGFEIQEEITMGIVSTLKMYNAKAIGYVNEGKLHKNGVLDEIIPCSLEFEELNGLHIKDLQLQLKLTSLKRNGDKMAGNKKPWWAGQGNISWELSDASL